MNKELEESQIDMSEKIDRSLHLEKKMGKWTVSEHVSIVFGSAAAASLHYQQKVINKVNSTSIGVMKCLEVMNSYIPGSKEYIQSCRVMANLLENLPEARKENDVWKAKLILIDKEAKEDSKIRKSELDKEFKRQQGKNPVVG